MKNLDANTLIKELLAGPESFFSSGKSYDLLQFFFNGFPLSNLRAPLESNDIFANRVAIWIISELGREANELSDYVVPLLVNKDRYVKYHSLDALMVFASSSEKSLFRHVLNKLVDEDDTIRKRAMYLVSNASDFLLKEGLMQCRKCCENDHARGLSFLLTGEALALFQEFNDETSDLLDAYSAIYIKRNLSSLPKKLWEGLVFRDSAINTFLKDYCT